MTRVTLGAAALSLPMVAAVTVLPASASSHPPPPITVEPLTPRSVFTGADVHSAFGSSSEPTTLIATFLCAPASGLLTIPEATQVPCS